MRLVLDNLKIELENLKYKNGRIIALPAIVFAIDTEDKEFGFSAVCLWYTFSITYYYGKSLDC